MRESVTVGALKDGTFLVEHALGVAFVVTLDQYRCMMHIDLRTRIIYVYENFINEGMEVRLELDQDGRIMEERIIIRAFHEVTCAIYLHTQVGIYRRDKEEGFREQYRA